MKFRISINPGIFYGLWNVEWAGRGYPNACTVGYSLGGDAESFTNIVGNDIVITPDSDVDLIGPYSLNLIARYTVAIYEPTVPQNQFNSQEIKVAV